VLALAREIATRTWTAQGIHKIVDGFNRRLAIPKYSGMVSLDEIGKNEFNFDLSHYIDLYR
jgi:type I restriction enzyme M protein